MLFFKEERRRMTKIIVLDLCNNLLKLLYYCFSGGFFCVKLCQMSKGEVVNFQLLILSKDLMRRMIKNWGISQALTLIFYEVGLTSALCYFFINWLPKCWKLKSNTLSPISRPNIYRVFKKFWRTFLKVVLWGLSNVKMYTPFSTIKMMKKIICTKNKLLFLDDMNPSWTPCIAYQYTAYQPFGLQSSSSSCDERKI